MPPRREIGNGPNRTLERIHSWKVQKPGNGRAIKILSRRKVYSAPPFLSTCPKMKREHVSKENKHAIWKKQCLLGQTLVYSLWHLEYSWPNSQHSNHSQKSQVKPTSWLPLTRASNKSSNFLIFNYQWTTENYQTCGKKLTQRRKTKIKEKVTLEEIDYLKDRKEFLNSRLYIHKLRTGY